jgi:two-component system sensor histidine kinase KdpD
MLDLDPVLFEQALFNLLDNASKYSPRDTKIRIEAWQEDDFVKLEVSDEGRGIPAEEIDRIFEKFHRADKEDQVQAGTGLGLAISRGFIEAMGGSLIAANRSDRQGAVFIIAMPVPKAAGHLDTAA